MEKVSQENVNLVIDSLNEFYDRILKTKIFNVQDFMNFMEPKFQAAGYRENKKIGDQTNILIIHDSGVGDFVVMTGAIREIRRIYPESFITLIVYPRALSIAECCPYVDEVISNPRCSNMASILSVYDWNVKLVRSLLKKRFDFCYVFTHYTLYHETLLLMYMSGARQRITNATFANDKVDQFTYDVPIQYSLSLPTHLTSRRQYGLHKIDFCFSLIEHMIQAPISNRSTEIWYTPTRFSLR